MSNNEVAAAAAAPPPHIVLVCFPTQGHINPTLRLAKRLASKGLLATFVTTSGAGAKIAAASASPPGAMSSGVRVGRGRVRFEFLDDHGNERDDLMRFLAASAPAAFAELLHRHADVACVVGNPFLPWAVDVAADAGVPAAVLWPQSCAVFSVYYHFAHGLVELPPEEDDDHDDARVVVSIPGIPPLSVAELPSFLLPSNPFKMLTEAILGQFENIGKSSWVFVNSFSELELDVLAAFPSVSPTPPELIPVGPLIELDDDAVRGDMIKAADDECVRWLDTQSPRSVVYVAVGSIVELPADEVTEMAHGLASTGRPFLWVLRPETRPLLPEGFVVEVAAGGGVAIAGGGRGVVVPWSPQERVLGHAATGCFLTHCGWNSTLETVAAGVPVVAFPQWGDQCTDAKFMVEELGIGVRLRAPPLRREAVREAVEAAVAGEDADAMLARATSWSAAARAAVAPGGSSDRHVQAFVDEVTRRASGKASSS
ncbi:hypothetical protein HU200_055624 [Digitaria exilis]|uniref:Glycosyltransferase n=1 Tax=Digitaria exilis TaxID=1010633 RepID=A0A835E5S9_9POAL|nr:hypothetical protein HU200_055624 [Digitaria exilis]CAB3472074.1 unnamed protein product [Digitaria exilis]